MTKPTIDERIVPLLGALALIDELRKDNADYAGGADEDRRRIAELEAEIVSIEAENMEWVSKLEAVIADLNLEAEMLRGAKKEQ